MIALHWTVAIFAPLGLVLVVGLVAFTLGVRLGMRVAFSAPRPKLLSEPGTPPILQGRSAGDSAKTREARKRAMRPWNAQRRRLSDAEREALRYSLSEGKLDEPIRKLIRIELGDEKP